MTHGLYEWLCHGFARDPDAIALDVADGDTWSYAMLDDTSGRIAQRLSRAGAVPGTRIVVQVEKSPQAVAAYLACLRLGAIYVPLNPAYTEREVSGFVTDCDPTVVVTDPGRAGQLAHTVLTLDSHGNGTLVDDLEGLVPAPPAKIDLEDVAAMLYTSGTTGRSKGAMLSHRALIENAAALCDLWAVSASDVLIHALPIFHTHGLFVALNTMFRVGGRVRFLERYSVDGVTQSLPGATVMMGVPTYYTRLLEAGAMDRSSCAGMRVFISGSAPLSSDASDRFYQMTGHRILERYGMTEAGMITSNPLDGPRVPGSVGYPLPGYEVRVRHPDGSLAEPGEPGVLEIRGPHLFSGYWGSSERTADEHTADGFFVTGDVVVAEADGRLRIVGRHSDLVITGGLNVYPREVEQVLDGVPGVVESAVTGLPDDDLGEAVAAFLVVDRTIERDELDEAVASELAGFKHPKSYHVVPELPRNAMGKVQKNRLRP